MPDHATPHTGDATTEVDVLAVDDAVLRSVGSAGFGVTEGGFVAKPYARLLAEKLATARALLGDDLDLTSGSVIRKLLEVSALEDARTWAALAGWYDDSFVVSATGAALDALGEELGLARPHEQATGTVDLALAAPLPPDVVSLTLPRGARMLTAGGDHAALDESVTLSVASPTRTAAASAFLPGPEHDLDPAVVDGDGVAVQRIDRWHPADGSVVVTDPAGRDSATRLADLERDLGAAPVTVSHTVAFTGGDRRWSDARYRALLLRAPRSLWRADALELAASQVPGVRQVLVRDSWGGLDLREAAFGEFRFVERAFSSDRDLASPYYVTVLVAPTPAALWDGPDGIRAAVEAAIEDIRPISIFPRIEKADEVGIGVAARVVVEGLALPAAAPSVVNDSAVARALKARLLDQVQRYVDGLRFGEPVRWAEVLRRLMTEPGVVDVVDLRLLRFPPDLTGIDLPAADRRHRPDSLTYGENAVLTPSQVPVLVADDTQLVVG